MDIMKQIKYKLRWARHIARMPEERQAKTMFLCSAENREGAANFVEAEEYLRDF